MSDTENEADLFGDEAAQVAEGSGAPSPGGSTAGDGGDGGDGDGPDLFGEDSPKPARSRTSSSTPPSSPARTLNPLEYPEEEGEEAETQEVWADVAVPVWPRLQATDGKVWHLKLPAYVNHEPNPFDPDYYRATADNPDEKLTPIEAKGKMIGVRNTMRWRWVSGPDGMERESNARMLRWSDGSVSLQLGSEMFDVAPSYGTTLKRPQDLKEGQDTGRSKETTFICQAAPNEGVLVTETAIAGQLNLVPTSMDSKTHRELVKHVGQQHVKHSKMKLLDDEADAETVAMLLARAAPSRQAEKPRRSTTRRTNKGDGLGKRRTAFKRADSEDSLGSPVRGRRAGEYDEDDGFVVADSDDDSEEDERRRRKKKGKRRQDEDDMDETELAERRLEAQAREKKRAKKEKGRGARAAYSDSDKEDAEGEAEDDDMEMDVESEEE